MNDKNNGLLSLLDIEYPLILGGMAWVGTAKLAAAVSEAGGLGTIGAGGMTPDILKSEINRIRTLTDKRFAVNLMLLNPHIDELVDICLEKGVEVFIFGAGNPGKYIKRVKENHRIIMAVVASETLALRLEREGVDAIIGEGMECGGHIGSLTTMTLIPKLVRTLTIPVVAAGGIATPEQVQASFVLGAKGVQIGTRFIASDECEANENYKYQIIKSKIRDTVITGGKLGHPARSIKTKFTRRLGKLEYESPEDAERLLIGSLRKAFQTGNEEDSVFMAGQSVGLIDEIKSVKDIIEELFSTGKIQNEYKDTVVESAKE
ncbi:MAG: nitronate monooxygenase [Thermotogota bacterium]|nr:nitronate monooxygenase [Thermotogota bacterium]